MVADQRALLNWLLCEGWRHQDEMVYWLWYECGVLVHRSTISRILKHNGWSQKQLYYILLEHSEELYQAYCDEMRHFVADNLVFLDESIFNEKTGWRHP